MIDNTPEKIKSGKNIKGGNTGTDKYSTKKVAIIVLSVAILFAMVITLA